MARISEQLLAFEEDRTWIEENLEELLGKYPEQWIAVKNGQVIASAPDFESLLSMVSDPAHTCIGFISKGPLEMVL